MPDARNILASGIFAHSVFFQRDGGRFHAEVG